MSDPAEKPPMLSFPWTWRTFGANPMLVTAGGGAMVVLASPGKAALQTRDPVTGLLRPIKPEDPVARAIAATPDLAIAAMNAWKALSWIIAYDSEDKTLARAIGGLETAIEKAGTFDFAAMRAKVEADRIAHISEGGRAP